MNLKELEYIVKIAEEQNITHAAHKLYLTPSALNQQLLHIEQELGMPLFHRGRGGFSITEAGEIYLQAAREMLHMKKQVYNRIQDLASIKNSTLSIGFPPERGATMFTTVYPNFHHMYPEISINVYEISVHQQQMMIANGELDIGFLTLQENQKTDDEHILIRTEEIYLAVPSIHPVCQYTKQSQNINSFPELSLNALRHEPFALMYRESTLRPIIDHLFRQAGFNPTVLFETARTSTMLSMVANRMCCAILPAYLSIKNTPGVTFFTLPDHPVWELTATYKKQSYLSKAARDFYSLAAEYWNSEY